ncbi:hypothetical protein K491DRAFT_695139 [Lophiostoma macrostomum CBS 122681]|uniref:Uncharacterized protein n=1 Tax=Lophiostoma macrostomum CBS 122681 TaxID=1314788 RepID=A0A6A6SZ33_9PLEO|nr:hypothetical protein K491DRAFT_695139 [Lophiostoma macrostomum CBS 122681]
MTNPAGFWAQKNAAVFHATTPASKSQAPGEVSKDDSKPSPGNPIALEKPQNKTSWADIVEEDGDLPVQATPTPINGKANGIVNGTSFKKNAGSHPSQEKKSWRSVKAGGPSSANGSGAKEEWTSFPSKREAAPDQTTKKMDERIRDLESELQKKEFELETKELELQNKESWIKTLVAEVDDKDRKTNALEEDLDKKSQRIHELEAVIKNLQVSLKVAIKSKEQEGKISSTLKPQPAPEEETWVEVNKPSASVKEHEARKDDASETEQPAQLQSPPTSEAEIMSELDLPAPLEDAESPEPSPAAAPEAPQPPQTQQVSTAAKPKAPTSKDVPPPKPAPKLSFPLKNGGKIEKNAATETWANHPENKPGSWSAGQTTKDIRDMTQAERQALGKGPTITVMIGNKQFHGVPKHMFMYVSPKVKAFFDDHANESYLSLKEGQVAPAVMQVIVDWLKNMCTSPKVYSLKLRGDTMQDLAIRRDCYYLGMEKYVAHFTKQYCDKVRSGFPSLENIALIEKSTGDDDTLFRCMSNNLAVARVKNNIPEPEKFEAFLEKHPRLAQAIGSIEVQLKANRSGASTPKQGPKKVGKRGSPLKGNAGSAGVAPES